MGRTIKQIVIQGGCMRFFLSGFVVTMIFCLSTFAKESKTEGRLPASAIPSKVQSIAQKMKMNDVRTIIKQVKGAGDGNPCEPTGTYWEVTVEVKKQVMSDPAGPAKYVWERVRNVSVDNNGGVMEICQE